MDKCDKHLREKDRDTSLSDGCGHTWSCIPNMGKISRRTPTLLNGWNWKQSRIKNKEFKTSVEGLCCSSVFLLLALNNVLTTGSYKTF